MNKFYNRKVITIIGFTTAILCGCSSTAKNFAETTSSAVDGAAVSESTESVTSMPETEVTTGETEGESAASAKTIDDLVKEAAKVSDFTEEELESIAEDARVYEAYGSDAETAFDMAMKDAVYGKSNGQQDYAVTIPQVVDENGNPYPTDEYGGVVVPETTPASTEVAENTGMIDDNGIDPNVYADLPLTKDATASEEEGGYNLKIYGNDEFFIVTEKDGTIHYFNDGTKLQNYLVQLYFSSDEYIKQQQESGLVEWDGVINDTSNLAMTGEELRQWANDPNAVHGELK